MTKQAKVCGQGGCQRPVDPETGSFEGCAEHRALFDATAQEEAWSHALELLEPMREIAQMFGSRELSGLLQKAQDEGDAELNRALDALEAARERVEA